MRLSGGAPIDSAAAGETPGANIRTTMTFLVDMQVTCEFRTTPSRGGHRGGSSLKVSPGSG